MKDVNRQRRGRDQQNLKPIEKRQTEKPRLDLIIKNGKDRERAGEQEKKEFHRKDQSRGGRALAFLSAKSAFGKRQIQMAAGSPGLFHDHFHIVIKRRDYFEIGLVGFVVVTRDGHILTLGEDQRWKSSDQFADHVAAGR